MTEQPRDAIGNRQAEAQALAVVAETAELLEDQRAVGRRDAGPAVPDLDPRRGADAAHADHDAPAQRVAHCIGEEVLEHAPQQLRVAVEPDRRGHVAQHQAFLLREYAELGGQSAQQRVGAERLPHRHQAAGVQARDVEQAGQQFLGRAECTVDVRERLAILRMHRPLRQRVHEQMRRVERLRQIVADRGEQARLGLVGLLGRGAGARQRRSAFGHAQLQMLGDLLEAGLGLAERGDVGERRDEAAARHRIAANLDQAAVREGALGQQRRAGTHVLQAARDHARDLRLLKAFRTQRVYGEVADRPADLQQRGRKTEQLRIACVPGHQVEIAIDHADALRHVLERRLEQALVEAQRLRGLADDRGDGVQIAALLAARRVEQQPRRGRAEHGRQLALDALDLAGVGDALTRFANEMVDALGRQEAPAQIAQRRDVELGGLNRTRPCRAHRQQQRHRGLDQQAQHDRAAEAAPAREPEQMIGREPGQPERTRIEPGRRGQRRHQQAPGPDRDAGGQAEQHRARRRLRPQHREQHRRRQRAEARERQRADVGQCLAAAGRAAVDPGQQHHDQDHHAALAQYAAAQVADVLPPRAAHQQRRQPVIADHQAQRERGDDDHAGRGAEAAEERQQREHAVAVGQRQRQHVQIRRHVQRPQAQVAGTCQRQQRQRDQAHVQRKQPARGAQMAHVAAFGDTDVIEVRQREQREHAEHDQARKAARTGRRIGRRVRPAVVEQHPGADREHRAELEQRFERDRQHQAAVVLGRADAARAEQHREQRQHQRDVERAVVPRRRLQRTGAREQVEAHRDGLELQRDVRNDAEDRDQRDRGGQPRILAEPRGDQIGDRGAVRVLDQAHQPLQQAEAEHVEQDRADEGRRQPPARTRGLRDRAVERPGGAVRGQRQGVDVRPAPRQAVRMAFAPDRRGEQQAEPDQAGGDDQQAQHRAALAPRLPDRAGAISASARRARWRASRSAHHRACRSRRPYTPTSPSMLSDSAAPDWRASEGTARRRRRRRPSG